MSKYVAVDYYCGAGSEGVTDDVGVQAVDGFFMADGKAGMDRSLDTFIALCTHFVDCNLQFRVWKFRT